MSALAVPQKDINRARAGFITTSLLERLRDIAAEANAGHATTDAANLFLLCMPGVCEELLDYRRRAAEGCEMDTSADTGTVIAFRGDT